MRMLLASLVLSSCSLDAVNRSPCADNVECRNAFGFGSTCADDGYCDVVQLHPRCQSVYPADLTLPVDPEAYFVYGTIFDHALDTHVGRYRSVQLAMQQANENGGLEGRQAAVIHCTNQEDAAFDALTKDEATVEVARFLAAEVGVPAIVGPAASGRTEATYNEVAQQHDVLIISPSATSPTLTPLDGTVSTDDEPGLLWRTCPPDDFQAVAISWDMLNNFDPEGTPGQASRPAPSLNVGVIHQTGAYGEGLNAAFTALHDAVQGGQTTSYPFSNDSTRNDAVVDAIDAGHDELLFISSDSTDVIAFLQSVSTFGDAVDDLPLFLTDAARNADVLGIGEPARSLLNQVRGSAPASPDGAEFSAFRTAYAAAYDGADVGPLSFTPHSFDAGWLVLYGTAWAIHNEDGVSGTTIARGLRRVSSGPVTPIRAASWNAVKAAFQDGDAVDVVGASGSLDFDSTTGETSAPIDIWGVAFPTYDSFPVLATLE